METKHKTFEALVDESKQTSRCPGCDGRLADILSFPARSRFEHGDLCSDCGRREAFEGDFIRERMRQRLARSKSTSPSAKL